MTQITSRHMTAMALSAYDASTIAAQPFTRHPEERMDGFYVEGAS